MSRSTQFVGLTDAASRFVTDLESIGEHVGAEGIAGEPVHMGHWRDSEGHEYVEVAQIIPWSSGPCIFTCLEWRVRGEEPQSGDPLAEVRRLLESGVSPEQVPRMLELLDSADTPDRTLLFEWTLDPTLRGRHMEWDHSSGTYWI